MSSTAKPSEISTAERFRAYLQLMRLPAVFTAIADVLMGGWFVYRGEFADMPWAALAVLCVVSASLYLSGMVLNDLFDRKKDARERPHRPIPSGRVSPGAAQMLGAELMLLGVGMGWFATYLTGNPMSGWIAVLLAAAIIAYDGLLKNTMLGPLAMGSCRFLNVLLGMTLVSGNLNQGHFLVAAGIGLYIAGITLFARSESATSSRVVLAIGTTVSLGGIALVAWFPNVIDFDIHLANRLDRWYLFIFVIGALIGWRFVRAIAEPTPAAVQRAVGNGLMSLIILNAAISYAVAGMFPAIGVLILVVPAMLLGRIMYVT